MCVFLLGTFTKRNETFGPKKTLSGDMCLGFRVYVSFFGLLFSCGGVVVVWSAFLLLLLLLLLCVL